MKIQVKSGEIPVRKNVGKIMQNFDSRRLTPKSAKLKCYPILKFGHGKTWEKIWRYQKQVWRTVGFSYKEQKYISNVWNVEQFDIGQLGCEASLVLKFEIFGQVRCRTCNMGPYKWLYRHL